MVAVVVTDERLILQKLRRSRDLTPDGEPAIITRETLADVRLDGGGGLGSSASALIMDKASVELKLRSTDGQKYKLRMMSGEGPMGLGKLGGGEFQRQGVLAIAEWLNR